MVNPMLPEQQRIMGFFIEEAKDHLNTIEHGLLNLQDMLKDPEMINEVFRAAHSVKGGAAMLGLNSIQQTSHHLEDYFKVIKESPTLQVDQKLESLFLRVFDTLQELLEHLERSFGLTEDVANNLMSEVEPVFEALKQHLGLLLNQAGVGGAHTEIFSDTVTSPTATAVKETTSLLPVFQNQVLQQLREMLQLFKQPETPQSRQQLQECCHQLIRLGEQFNLSGWCNLSETASGAIANLENTYIILAPIVIKELQQAQKLVLAGRGAEISTSERLQSLSRSITLWDTSPETTPLTLAASELDFGDLFDTIEETEESVDLLEALTDASSTEDADFSDFWKDSLFDLETKDVPEATDSDLENWLGINITDARAQEPDEVPAEAGYEEVGQHHFEPAKAASQDLETLFDEETSADFSEDLFDTEAEQEEFSVQASPVIPCSPAPESAPSTPSGSFCDLEKLLDEEADKTVNDSPTVKPNTQQATATNLRRPAFEQTMRVPVKHLDNISNLVGELVVNRNSLEQGQEKLRQFLDNLLHQVQQLSDLGYRMHELYELSLLEASLITTRQGHQSASPSDTAPSREPDAAGMNFDALEMDRFTRFHTISQEMLELIVRVRESSSDIEFITDETEQVARQFQQVTTHLQEGLTRSRMVPFALIADRLPRAVRDITLKYGKQAELHIEGQETLIDKMLLEQLYDPITHLVNNAITHGIETPQERSASFKSPVGKITIRAFHQGNQTVISVADDGAGIDAERVKAKAIQKGLITPDGARTMSHLDVYNLLFHPGFSTKDQVDDFAGRGIGMDVVRTSLSEIRGVINTDSTLGKGTTFTIRLPLTLSICKALCCLSDKARIAFPMDGVEDMMEIPTHSVRISDEGKSCIPWRDSLLPFRPLKELLTYNRQLSRGNVYGGNHEDEMISIVVLRSADTLIALEVDQVLGEQEIVIKQFEGPAPKPFGVAGVTIMGDGRIMPIADVLELIDISMGRLQREGSELWAQSAAPLLPETPKLVKTEPTVLIVDDSITVRELLSLTFNKAGYRVEQARDGQEAWDKLRDGLPCDIVFCDIEMPRMDGLELLSRMQKDPNLSQLPIAMLTSRGADRHRQMAVQLGASGYFTKPYLEEALLDGAQRMIKGEVLVTTNSNA